MNAVATITPALVPASIGEAMQLAEMMAGAKLVPQALQKSPADCLMVIQQAVRWQMDPFAVAQECSVIQGKLMHSGKLVAAVVNSRGNLTERLSFAYSGEGQNRTITVRGRLHGESEARTVTVRLADAKTNNRVWQSQPDQQLMYHGCRVWARRHTPELMLGVYSPEEFDEAPNGHGEPREMKDITPQAGGRKSSAQSKRDGDWEKLQQDLLDCHSVVAVNRLLEQYQTDVFPRWKHDWIEQGREAIEKRAAELTAEDLPGTLRDSIEDAEAGLPPPKPPNPQSRAEYVQWAHEQIAAAPGESELRSWWEDEAAARRRFRLTKDEVEGLKERLVERRNEIAGEAPYGRDVAGNELHPLEAG